MPIKPLSQYWKHRESRLLSHLLFDNREKEPDPELVRELEAALNEHFLFLLAEEGPDIYARPDVKSEFPRRVSSPQQEHFLTPKSSAG